MVKGTSLGEMNYPTKEDFENENYSKEKLRKKL